MAYLIATLLVLAIAYTSGRKPLYGYVDWKLAEAQHEHARWVAICLEFTGAGCDAEAKIAAEQVVELRAEINFYRRMLGRMSRTSAKRA